MAQVATPQLARDCIQRFGMARMVVAGSSMLPALWPGTRLRIVAPARYPAPGDLVAIEKCQRLVVHRVVAIRDGNFITQGDNCVGNDGSIAHAHVVGLVPGLAIFRWHLWAVPASIARPLQRAWLQMVPLQRKLWWLLCALTRRLRRNRSTGYADAVR